MVTPLMIHSLSYMHKHVCFMISLNVFPSQVVGNSVAFSLGLATTLAILGIAASFAGKAYGQIGQGLPLAASGLAVVMGLNLLEVLVHAAMACRGEMFCSTLSNFCYLFFL